MYKILVVEDDPDNLDILSEVLGDANYSVVAARNAADAVALAVREQPALILLDLQMPDSPTARTPNPGAGAAVLVQLRGDPATATIPVVAVSGRDRNDVAAMRDAGFDAVAGKPYDFAALLRTVAHWVGRP